MKRMRSLLAVLFVFLLALSQTMCGGGGGGGAEITTTSSDTTAPSTPTGLTAKAVSTSQIDLSWTTSTDNVGVVGYRVTCVYPGGSRQEFVTMASYSDTGLSASTQYCYTISAFDAAGNESTQSDQVCATTLANPWTGVKVLGTTEDDVATGIAVDSNGNVYVTGYSKGDLNDPTKPAKSDSDIFLIKYDPTGTKQWIVMKDLSPGSNDFAKAVAVGKEGSIYIAGDTQNQTGKFIFLAKYDSSGSWHWTQTKSLSGGDYARGVAVDSKGYIFVTGEAVDWTVGYGDIFLIKYDSSGNEQWADILVDPLTYDFGRGVVVDKFDHIYIVGDKDDYRTGHDIILARYKDDPDPSQRKWEWSTTLPINNSEMAGGIAADSRGNIYIVGDTVNLGPGGQNRNILLIKCDALGNKIWHREYDSINQASELGRGIAVDKDGYIYITGATEGKLEDDIPNPPDGQAIFLIKVEPDNGNMVWAQQLDINNDDSGTEICVDNGSNVYLTGYTNGNIEHYPPTWGDIFIAKYDSNGVLQ